MHYTPDSKKCLSVQIRINFQGVLCIPRNLQRLFTLQCLLICSQIPECWWGQASIRFFDTYIKKDNKGSLKCYASPWSKLPKPQHQWRFGLNTWQWGVSCVLQSAASLASSHWMPPAPPPLQVTRIKSISSHCQMSWGKGMLGQNHPSWKTLP